MLRGVIPFEALDQPPGFGGQKGFVEGRLAPNAGPACPPRLSIA